MGRWTGSWLSGPEAAGVGVAQQRWRGERLGLPERGQASIAPAGRRFGALVLDIVLSYLVASALVGKAIPGAWSSAVFFVEYVVLTVLSGQSVGMRLTGLRVVRVGAAAPVDPLRAVVRTLLLLLLVPALIWDADGRGLHDKASGTAVVRA